MIIKDIENYFDYIKSFLKDEDLIHEIDAYKIVYMRDLKSCKANIITTDITEILDLIQHRFNTESVNDIMKFSKYSRKNKIKKLL